MNKFQPEISAEYMQTLSNSGLRSLIRSTAPEGKFGAAIALAHAEIRRRQIVHNNHVHRQWQCMEVL